MTRLCEDCGSEAEQTRTYRMNCPECGSIRIIDTVSKNE